MDLLRSLPPFQFAGLLYIGAALGVLPSSMRQSNDNKVHRIGERNLLRLLEAITLGGVAGPVLLLFGLRMVPAVSVGMWLNLELATSAILGCVPFRDHLGRNGWMAVTGTIEASVLLSWHEGTIGLYALLLVGAGSICWGLDNHLTALRHVKVHFGKEQWRERRI